MGGDGKGKAGALSGKLASRATTGEGATGSLEVQPKAQTTRTRDSESLARRLIMATLDNTFAAGARH